MNILNNLSILLIGSIFLTGCGDSGNDSLNINPDNYSGVTSPATVDTSSTDNLITAVIESTKTQIDYTASQIYSTPYSNQPKLDAVITKSQDIMKSTSDLPAGVSQTLTTGYCDTGSVVVEYNNAQTEMRITYYGCTNTLFPGSDIILTFNGTFYAVQYNDGASYFGFDEFSISDGTDTLTISFTMSCSAALSCNMIFTGDDNRTYQVSLDFTVTGNNTTGYYVNGTVYDPDHGHITVETTTGLVFDPACIDGGPSSGSVIIYGASGSSATVTFTGCSSYTVN